MADLSDNPFLQKGWVTVKPREGESVAEATVRAAEMASEPSASVAAAESNTDATLPACGQAHCTKSHRTNGSHYSSDPSVRSKELTEDGKFGPQFGRLGGARARSRQRATQVIAEAAAEHADQIRQVFIDGIDPDRPIGIRMAAAKEMLAVEEKDIQRELKERQAEFDKMNKEELTSGIMEMLAKLQSAHQVTAEVEQQIYDAQVVDDD